MMCRDRNIYSFKSIIHLWWLFMDCWLLFISHLTHFVCIHVLYCLVTFDNVTTRTLGFHWPCHFVFGKYMARSFMMVIVFNIIMQWDEKEKECGFLVEL